ncbi:hypothetical protein [Chromobacterium haemolyticum]|uniref:hypothetical protein n=1 Tax=Chromobacterium haemolyticum TaxID=394935 RepID=UPI001C38428A|nr:hypothetical protein [Chromobacterium haemolyticum]
MKKTVLLSWSSGKDSAWALHVLRRDPDVEVVGLFTTVNQAFQRVAITRCGWSCYRRRPRRWACRCAR